MIKMEKINQQIPRSFLIYSIIYVTFARQLNILIKQSNPQLFPKKHKKKQPTKQPMKSSNKNKPPQNMQRDDLFSFFQKVNHHLRALDEDQQQSIILSRPYQLSPEINNLKKLQQDQEPIIKYQYKNMRKKMAKQPNKDYSQSSNSQNEEEEKSKCKSSKSQSVEQEQTKTAIRKSQRLKKPAIYAFQNQKYKEAKEKRIVANQEDIQITLFDQIKEADANLVRKMRLRFQPTDKIVKRGLYYKIVCKQDQKCQVCKDIQTDQPNQSCKKCVGKGGYWFNRKQLMKINNGNCLRQFYQSNL